MNDIIQHQGGGALMDPANAADVYKQYAQAYAEGERRGGQSITLRNGIMSVGDQPLPGNMFAGIVLDAVKLNAYYSRPFNPQVIEPPTCYAIGRDELNMAPHPDMAKAPTYFQPMAPACNGCQLNEFGSNRQTGKGKECSNRRRLLILPAGYYQQTPQGFQMQPITDLNHYATAPFLSMTLSPTTLQGWGQWVRKSAADYQRPTFGLIARIWLYAHPQHGKETVGFETIAPLPDEWFTTIMQRHQEAAQEIFEGFEAPSGPAQRGGGFHAQQQQAQGQAQGAIANYAGYQR